MFNKRRDQKGILEEIDIPEGKIFSFEEVQEIKTRMIESLQKQGCPPKKAKEAALNYSISILLVNLNSEQLEKIESFIFHFRDE